MAKATNHVSVRLDAATFARIDALVPQFSIHGRSAKRSAVLRALILTGLDRHAVAEGLEPTQLPAVTVASAAPGRKRVD